MPKSYIVVLICSVSIIVLGVGVASGQNYPNKPIRIVASGVGTATDFAARLIAQEISGPLGQAVIVDNRASGVIPGEVVSKATPDGYTLLVIGSSFGVGALLQKTPYDPLRDFLPITLVARQPNVLVVHPSLPAKSVEELITLAKARPGALNYASSGAIGGSTQLAAALFESMAGVSLVGIPYKSSAQGITDLIGGHVHLSFAAAATVRPHVKSGKLKALAVTSAERSELFPGLPTVAATGLPGYEAITISGIVAPVKTPVPIIQRLNQEITRVLNAVNVRDMFISSGAEAAPSSPEALAATMKSDVAKWSKVLKLVRSRAD